MLSPPKFGRGAVPLIRLLRHFVILSGLLRIHMSWAAGWSVTSVWIPLSEERVFAHAHCGFVFAFMCGFRVDVLGCVEFVLESL